MPKEKGLFWVLTENIAGMRNQALGLAEAMSPKAIVCHTVNLDGYHKWIAPYSHHWWKDKNNQFKPPWPEIIIACGRKAIPPALWIKKNHKVPVIYIQNPYISTHYFDVVVAPNHDNLPKKQNVITMTGSCHRITPRALEQARTDFSSEFNNSPQPRRVVFIGGPNRAFKMPLEQIQSLIKQLLQEPGDLFVTVSRRTPQEIINILKKEPNLKLILPEANPNPYMGLIAWSDICILTCDSVNMVCEVMASGKPTYLIPLPGGNKKFKQFHDELTSKNLIRWYQPNIPTLEYSTQTFNEMNRVASLGKETLSVK